MRELRNVARGPAGDCSVLGLARPLLKAAAEVVVMNRRLLLVVALCTATAAGCVATLGDPGEEKDGVTTLALGERSVRYFEYAGLDCAAGQLVCRPEQEKCLCPEDFRHQNYAREVDGRRVGHYLVMGGDGMRGAAAAQGNRLAVNVNELNTDWQTGGAARAEAIMTWARAHFPGGVPEWILANEISHSMWADETELGVRYRRYVAQFARTLHERYGRSVVILAPSAWPGHRASDWRAIAAHAFIGSENYLSGREIAASGFSEPWCRAQYQRTLDAFARLGVPANRVMLVEHFGHTRPEKGWGRAGVGRDAWERAIRVRTRAALPLPFAGYITYGWSRNGVEALADTRWAAQDIFHSVLGGRLSLPARPSAAPASSGADEEPEPAVDPGAEPAAEPPAEAPPAPAPEPPPPATCVPRACGAALDDPCGASDDGCGHALACPSTCEPELVCTTVAGRDGPGHCRMRLAEPCAADGQCVSDRCASYYTGGDTYCCNAESAWCDSDLKCCGAMLCVGGRCTR